jgi:hypothetical protein
MANIENTFSSLVFMVPCIVALTKMKYAMAMQCMSLVITSVLHHGFGRLCKLDMFLAHGYLVGYSLAAVLTPVAVDYTIIKSAALTCAVIAGTIHYTNCASGYNSNAVHGIVHIFGAMSWLSYILIY